MLLKILAHLTLDVPDPLVMQIREHTVPERVRELLTDTFFVQIDELGETPYIFMKLDEIGGGLPLVLERVEWRGDFIMRVLREIREAAAEVRIVADDGEMHVSVVDARANR